MTTAASAGAATNPLPRRPSLRATATGLAAVTFICQLLGLGSSILMTSVLGASRDTDAFLLSLLIPAVATAILITALRSGAIPELTKEARLEDRQSFDRAVSSLVVTSTLIATALGIIVAVLAIVGSRSLLPDWSSADLNRLGTFSLMMIPYTAMSGALGAMSAALAVRGSFKPAAAIWGFESISKMIFLIAVPSIGAMCLALGCLVGQGLAVSYLTIVMRRRGLRLVKVRELMPPVVRRSFSLAAPLLVASLILQFNPVVDRMIAGWMSSGAVTQLEIASRLVTAPQSILGSVMITPLVATWTTLVADRRSHDLTESLHRVLGASIYAACFLIAILVPMREQLIDLIFGRGEFTSQDVRITADVFALLLLGLGPALMTIGCASLFVAREETRFNMKVAFANLVLNTLLTLTLAKLMGLNGVVLGTSITYLLTLILYVRGINARVQDFSMTRLARQLLLAFACLIPAALTGWSLLGSESSEASPIVLVLGALASSVAFLAPILVIARRPRAMLDLLTGHEWHPRASG